MNLDLAVEHVEGSRIDNMYGLFGLVMGVGREMIWMVARAITTQRKI